MTALKYEPKDWKLLKPGCLYKVICGFLDEANVTHPVGETWVYLGFSYFPYDSGLTLYVSEADVQSTIRLELKEGLQREIDQNWAKYIRRV